jgi:protocatechuate 3,4-dioxygenase beta subunit
LQLLEVAGCYDLYRPWSHTDAEMLRGNSLHEKTNHYDDGIMPNYLTQRESSNPRGDVIPFQRHEAGSQPDYLYPAYRSTRLRAPSQPLIFLPHTLSEVTGPRFGHSGVQASDRDLTLQHADAPLGERIIVRGRVLDGDGHPVPNTLIEIWQANAAGRYAHAKDDHPAPLDPNFTGTGRTLTDNAGFYSFVTIKPGAYPWRNHDNAWRPAHVHFSLFGPAFVTRLITQMYFPGDPLLAYDPVLQSIPDETARRRLVSKFDLATTKPEWALGYHFDIVLRGRESTPFEKS